ncbi:MAG: GDSL-type esterase/lipase family protein [Chitinophagales bacterium]|nr:GDSL-type esterase/lipase family protein [Chitinophagales bacterium]
MKNNNTEIHSINNFLNRNINIQITLSVAQMLLILVAILLSCYFIWEIYWWNKVGLRFIKWHTHIVFASLCAGIIVGIGIFISRKEKNRNKKLQTLSTSLIIAMMVILLETALTLTDSVKTYSEIRSHFYQSPFEPDTKNYYHTAQPGNKVTVSAPEFSYTTSYNSLGYADAEWPVEKRKAFRIITSGDSFTEGDGAPMDSSYPALLRQMLGDSVEVLNAGVRGSDPVFGLKNMEDRFAAYHPDLVIQAVSENDLLFDMCIRGGYERFRPDSTVQFAAAPWWEPIYAMSYLSRVFFHALGFNMAEPCGKPTHSDFIARQQKLMIDILNRFEKAAKAQNTRVLIVFYPTKIETLDFRYTTDYLPLKKHIETLPHVSYADIMECYQHQITAQGKEPQDFYWVIDGHHNATGYHLMATCIAEAIRNWLQKRDNQQETR